MKLIFALTLLGLFTFHPSLQAEGQCPPGYYPVNTPGVMGCAPIPGYNQQQQQQQPRPNAPAYRWESRWGAIATDGIRGTLGTASDMQTKANAEKAAIKDCQNKGGTQCVLNVSYGNACGAMFVGDHGFSVNTGDTMDEANNAARQACSAKDQNCHAYYSNCSKAALVQ